MAYRTFEDGGFYHLFNRGVDRRKIFLQYEDNVRFLRCLKELNDRDALHVSLSNRKKIEARGIQIPQGPPLIRIGAYILLPNHFHAFFQVIDGESASKFLQKLGVAYTGYFNKKNDRSGPLFSGRMRTVHVDDERQWIHITRYIHLNALDLVTKAWRDGSLVLTHELREHLYTYRWSSIQCYTRAVQDDIIDTALRDEIAPDPIAYKQELEDWSTRSLMHYSKIMQSYRAKKKI